MKTFSEVELHYRYLAQDYPTNVHFCQLHNTLLEYAPDLEGVIKIVRDHIALKEAEAKKYSSDTFFVVECHQHIEADKEFLEFCEVPVAVGG